MGTSSSKSSRDHLSLTTTNNKRITSTRSSSDSFDIRKKEDVKERNERLQNKEVLSYSDIQLQGQYALKVNDIDLLPEYRISIEQKKIEKVKAASVLCLQKTRNSLYCSKGVKAVFESSYPKISV